MPEIQSLLTQVGLIVKKNNEILDATGGRFNIFNIIGIASDEVRLHSALLAELLNPNGSHGMKDAFLIAFVDEMKKVELDSKLAAFDFKSAKVKVEKTIGEVTEEEGGRIDIIIDDKNNNAIIIENKIYAGDQTAQLIRYDRHGKSKYNGNHTILYLTLDGHEASDGSAKNIKYIKISYAIHILHWLETCLSIAVRQPLVREIINQYISLIKQLTNQDMNTKNSQEIVDLLIKKDNIESALIISVNIEALKRKLVSDMVKRIADKCCMKEYIKDDSKEIGFYKENWKKDSMIYFGEGNGRTYYAIKTADAFNGNAIDQNRIVELFEKHSDITYNPYGWGYINDSHWSNTYQLYLEMTPGSVFEEKIISSLQNVLVYLKEHPEIENEL